jgi:hypothetical protein
MQQQQQQQQQQHRLPQGEQHPHHLGSWSLLEQKLELLERRFTEPLLESNHRNSPFTGNSSTTTINPFSSPFGINNNNNNNPNASSQHSFSFDTPSLSNTAASFQHSNSVISAAITNQKTTTTTGVAAAAAAAAASVGGGLQAVEQATARHMQRLLTGHNNTNKANDDDTTRSSQAIVVAASDTSQNPNDHILSNNMNDSSSSRSTLVAGNKTANNGCLRGTSKTRQTRLSPLPLNENKDAASQNSKSKTASSKTTVRCILVLSRSCYFT